MPDHQRHLVELHSVLGYKRLNRTWAKVEILLGLTAAGVGLLLGDGAVTRTGSEIEWVTAGAALALFVLGSYLALAGHRSHLYQSQNDLTCFLIESLSEVFVGPASSRPGFGRLEAGPTKEASGTDSESLRSAKDKT